MNHSIREGSIRLGLLDVVYGVVLAYGFTFIDQARRPEDYVLFALAYVVMIVDWLYVHNVYLRGEYQRIAFVLDIVILFLMSRLIAFSVHSEASYWAVFCLLFLFYFVWDMFTRAVGASSGFDWRFEIAGDAVTTAIFGGLFLMTQWGYLRLDLGWAIGTFVVYGGAVATWLIPARARGVKR